ncbi:hypothetical protein GC173_05925 [bacterium]|nr:hypothetical protein [bacterium]
MRVSSFISLLALSVAALASSASAQYYITGTVTDADWSPGTAARFDGGTIGVAGDLALPAFSGGTASITINGASGAVPNHSLTPGTFYYYKIATSGFGSVIPSGPANVLRAPADPNTAITFNARNSAFGDGYLPDPSEGFVGSSATALVFTATAGEWRFHGSIQSEIGAGTDWTYATGVALTDAGNGTLGDNIWATPVWTGIPAGTYEGLIIEADGDYDPKIGQSGLDGGSNLSINILSTADTAQILLNIETGRVKVDVQSAVVIDPGYYVSFDSTAQGYTPAEKMDVISPNLYAKTFVIPTAGDHWVRVYDENTTVWPAGAVELTAGATGPDGYTFNTTTPNQSVRVYFDRNTYSDGFLPASDFISVVNDDATHSLLNVFTDAEIVGALQSEFLTGDASLGDWTPTPSGAGMELSSIGDGVWSGTFTALLGGTGLEWKVAARTATWTGSWAQAADEQVEVNPRGLTHHIGFSPNYPGLDVTNAAAYSFTVDLKSGRAAVASGSTAPVPFRPSYLTTNSTVSDWSNY